MYIIYVLHIIMEITISKACIYKDGRCHGVFTDGSGVILHKGGHYTTYFSPTGEITRQVTLCTVSGLKSKILKLIKLCNSNLNSPISIFSEEIYKLTTHDSKILSCTFSMLGRGQSEVYKSIENSMSVSINKTKTLLRVTFPFLLPHRKPSWTESSTNRVHLTYEYATLTQIFHVSNLPEHWQPLLSLFFDNESDIDQSEEFTIMFPTSQSGEIWKADTISPSINIFSYLSQNISWYWTPDGTFYLPVAGNILIVIHEDESLLEASGDFFTHIKEDQSKKFTSDTVPVNVRNSNYKLHGFVKDCLDLQKLPIVSNNSENCSNDEQEFLDGVKFENEVEGVGTFIAYNDKSIRVLFEDRTLIRVYSDFTVSALSRNGESARFTLENPYGFESYIPVCVEFYNWAFLSQTEQVRRLNEVNERETIVNAEISRVERLANKIPAPVSEDISDSLLAAQKQLKETRELLNKINQI